MGITDKRFSRAQCTIELINQETVRQTPLGLLSRCNLAGMKLHQSVMLDGKAALLHRQGRLLQMNFHRALLAHRIAVGAVADGNPPSTQRCMEHGTVFDFIRIVVAKFCIEA